MNNNKFARLTFCIATASCRLFYFLLFRFRSTLGIDLLPVLSSIVCELHQRMLCVRHYLDSRSACAILKWHQQVVQGSPSIKALSHSNRSALLIYRRFDSFSADLFIDEAHWKPMAFGVRRTEKSALFFSCVYRRRSRRRSSVAPFIKVGKTHGDDSCSKTFSCTIESSDASHYMGLHFGSLELVLDHFVPSAVECAFFFCHLRINFFFIDDESASGFLGIPRARLDCWPSHVSYCKKVQLMTQRNENL